MYETQGHALLILHDNLYRKLIEFSRVSWFLWDYHNFQQRPLLVVSTLCFWSWVHSKFARYKPYLMKHLVHSFTIQDIYKKSILWCFAIWPVPCPTLFFHENYFCNIISRLLQNCRTSQQYGSIIRYGHRKWQMKSKVVFMLLLLSASAGSWGFLE